MGVTLLPSNLLGLVDLANTRELLDSRHAEDRFDLSRPYITRIYRRRFLVTTVTNQVGPLVVREAAKLQFGVAIGNYYSLGTIEPWAEYDMMSICTSIVASAASDDGMGWHIDVTYEPVEPAKVAEWQNPLSAPLEWSVDGSHFEKILDLAVPIDGDEIYPNGKPVLNSAQDPFDPPVTRDDARSVITIRGNVPDWDPVAGTGFNANLAATYRNTTNKYTWLNFIPQSVRIETLSAQSQWHPSLCDPTTTPPKLGYFWQITLGLQIDTETLWQKKVLDAGYRTWDATSHVHHPILIDGVPATAPVPLDGKGQMAVADSNGVIQGTYLLFAAYKQLDFKQALGIG